MDAGFFLSSVRWEWLIWTSLGLAGSAALLAIFSPRLFSALNSWSGLWVDTDKFTKKLDKRIDIEHRLIRYSRLLGAITVAAAGVLAVFSLELPHVGQWIALSLLGFVGAAGVLALSSPRRFSRLASWGSLWIGTDKLFETVDRRIDIDQYVIRHCRLFGVAVLVAVIVLTSWLIYTP